MKVLVLYEWFHICTKVFIQEFFLRKFLYWELECSRREPFLHFTSVLLACSFAVTGEPAQGFPLSSRRRRGSYPHRLTPPPISTVAPPRRKPAIVPPNRPRQGKSSMPQLLAMGNSPRPFPAIDSQFDGFLRSFHVLEEEGEASGGCRLGIDMPVFLDPIVLDQAIWLVRLLCNGNS